MTIELKDDLRLVQNMRKNAYVKDNGYTVGAVLKAKSGRKYTGCNIRISQSQSICAERVALAKAISEGEKEFEYIVLMGGIKGEEPQKYLPCEICKSFLKEFVSDDFKVYTIYNNKIEEFDFNKI